jgi:zinc transport system ATP-binding protein
MNETLVNIQNLSAGYNAHTVLKNISLKVYKQDFLGIIGPNGGGKTTLIKVILGLINPFSGIIRSVRKDAVGYMPQSNPIDKKFPIAVHEIIESGLISEKKTNKLQKQEKVDKMVREMELNEIKNKPVGELSGGQLQRTLLARSIISQPELLILDEPDSYITKPFVAHFYELLHKINKKTAIILISHDIETVISHVKNLAYVNETLHYHAGADIEDQWKKTYLNSALGVTDFSSELKYNLTSKDKIFQK